MNPEVNDSQPPDINSPKFSPSGKNEVKAIKNGSQALEIAQRLMAEDGQGAYTSTTPGGGRDLRRARVLAAFNGDAPYSEAILKAKGQSWRANVSFGFEEGVIGRATVPYNELVNGGDFVGRVEADLKDEKKTIIQELFTEAVDSWGRWEKVNSRTIQELLLYGWVTNIFADDYTPWPVFIAQRDSFVHQMSPNDVRDLDVFVWHKTWLIHELYERIADAEMAEKAGWKIETTRKAIEGAMPQDNNVSNRGWQSVEEAIRGGSFYYSMTGSKIIDTYHVFARELSGRVTHYIVLNSNGGQYANEDVSIVGDGPTLFCREERFDSFHKFLVYFDLEPGDGKWHGSRGLGQRAFNTHRAIDKLRCSILDQAFTSGLTILQPTDEASQIDLQLSVVGPFAVIPAGINVEPGSMPVLSATTFQADSLLLATSEQRIGDVVPTANSPLTGQTKTATEARIDATRQAAIGKSNLMRFLDPVSQLLSIMLHRLLKKNSQDKDAKRFQQKLKERGITDEDIAKIRGAKTTGQIDDAMGQYTAAMEEIFALFRGDPDINQLELKRRKLKSRLGAKGVEGLLIEKEDEGEKIRQVRAQDLEIGAMMGLGSVIPAAPNDDHVIHMQTGINWINQQLQQSQTGETGASPKQIDLVGQHLVQHLQFMEADKQLKSMAAEFKKTLQSQLEAVQSALAASVQAATEQDLAAQPTPQPAMPL